jgi:FkbM family methyltransferase
MPSSSIAHGLIDVYARRLPYHPGKWRVIEALVRLSGVGESDRGKDFTVGIEGLRWKLQTTCHIQRKLFYHGFIDRVECRQLAAHLPPGGVFFDIGSYFGWYSLWLARRCGAQAFAFEPVPENYALLAENVRLNPAENVRTFPVALSDQPGEVCFQLPAADNRGTGRILAEGGQRVPAITLDAFAAEQGITRLDAMKIDVEGAEVRVLAGGRATLERFRPAILIELNPKRLELLGASEAALLAALRELGYAIHHVGKRGLTPFTGIPAGQEYTNLFCLPAKEADLPRAAG